MAFSFKRAAGAAALALSLAPWMGAQAQVQAGPGTWSAEQTWANDTSTSSALKGYFYWPETQPVLANKRALVLVLHGCAQTAANDVIDSSSDKGFNWKDMADEYGAVILAPNATGNYYNLHCWDWARTNHSRTTGHDGVLLDLINRFVSNPQYAIDPRQIYVTGLSSGGSESMVLGCMAPDIFAGLGLSATPSPGVTTSQIGSVPPGWTAASAANHCKNLAGTYQSHFATQIASVVWGTNDYFVAQAYGPLNAAAMRLVYGGTYTKGATETVATGGNNTPYYDSNGKKRTVEMPVTGLSHAWPAGPGGQNTNYVDATKVNYPKFVMDFWFKNNLRVKVPKMTTCSASVSGSTVTVSGAATDESGPITSYRVVLEGPSPADDATAGSGPSFSKAYANRAEGFYTGKVTATNSVTGMTSDACLIPRFPVGNPIEVVLPPTGLQVANTTNNSISLSWNAASGASGYNVYRDGVTNPLNPTPLTVLSFTNTGLLSGTSYTYRVSSTFPGGESGKSDPVTGTTGSCTATTDNNYNHVQAGRAYNSGGYAMAVGSGQNMGLNNTFYTTTLVQTAPGYYVIGNCP
jgi:poly(3-hydroxybutyrate) depolymerase